MAHTRKELIDNPSFEAHRRYYAQFVSPAVEQVVLRAIGVDPILDSTDRHLNDIPLPRWEQLEGSMKSLCLTRMGEIEGKVETVRGGKGILWARSFGVCIAKEAARQIREAPGNSQAVNFAE